MFLCFIDGIFPTFRIIKVSDNRVSDNRGPTVYICPLQSVHNCHPPYLENYGSWTVQIYYFDNEAILHTPIFQFRILNLKMVIAHLPAIFI